LIQEQKLPPPGGYADAVFLMQHLKALYCPGDWISICSDNFAQHISNIPDNIISMKASKILHLRIPRVGEVLARIKRY